MIWPVTIDISKNTDIQYKMMVPKHRLLVTNNFGRRITKTKCRENFLSKAHNLKSNLRSLETRERCRPKTNWQKEILKETIIKSFDEMKYRNRIGDDELKRFVVKLVIRLNWMKYYIGK